MIAASVVMAFVLQATVPEADPKDEAVRRARQALVDELGPTAGPLSVERVEPVDWPDSGLGCDAAKGEVRQPVLTPGFRVILRDGGKSHEVHVGGDRARVCAAVGPANFITAAFQVSNLARKDLAARLGVNVKDVRVESIKPTTWPDRTLGCSPGSDEKAALDEPTKGFVVLLHSGGKDYAYNADTERAVFCPRQ